MQNYTRVIRWICIVSACLTMLLVGCGTQQDIAGIIEDGSSSIQALSDGEPIRVFSFPEIYYNFCITMDRWAAVIIVFSFLIGFILQDIFKTNKEIKKWALSVLIWKIPIIVFVGVYVYSLLYGAFTNYN